jgi:hypothetical protein
MIDASQIELEEAGYTAEYLAQRVAEKMCTKCECSKHLFTGFYRAMDSWCKDCIKAAMRENSAKKKALLAACTCSAEHPHKPRLPERPLLTQLGLKWCGFSGVPA